jgi:hypothetical protein
MTFFTADFFLMVLFAAVFLAGFREADFFAVVLFVALFGMKTSSIFKTSL